jgi:hypothetical protein
VLLTLLDVGSLAALIVWARRASLQYDAESSVLDHHSFTCVTDRPTTLILAVLGVGIALAAASGVLAVIGRRGRVPMVLLAIALILAQLALCYLRYHQGPAASAGGFLWSRFCSEG